MATRAEVLEVVQEWLSEARGPESVWHWANEAKAEANHDDPLVRDVVDVLADMGQDLITTEDAEVMAYVLGNPPDEADLGQNLLWNHLDDRNEEARRVLLAEHPFYGQFCAPIL